MDIIKNEIAFLYRKNLFESTVEQNIDTDYQLPDYYPEIVKVLKTLTEINIVSTQCNESGVNVGGQVVLTLLYLGSDDRPNSFTHTVPFAKHVDADNVSDGEVKVEAFLNYLNTKAVGPRKVESHGSLSLNVSVCGIESQNLLSEIECEGVYYKAQTLNFVKPLPMVYKSLFVEDEIQIPQNKPSVEKILRKCAKASVLECKCSGGKIVVKGSLDVQMLYCPNGGGRPILVNENYPFSQIMDCKDCGDNMNFDALAHVDNFELHPKTSLDGEVKTISFEAKVGVDVLPYCNTEANVVSDAFSGRFYSDITKRAVPYEVLYDQIKESFVCNKSIDLGEGIVSDVLDMWCEPVVEYVSKDNEELLIKGKLAIGLLCNDSDGLATYFERSVDFDFRYTLQDNLTGFRCSPCVTVSAVQYSLDNGGTVNVQIEILVSGSIFEVCNVEAIEKISIDFDANVKRDTNSAIILYFAENESVWDIAVKYQTSPQSICSANNLESEDEVCNKVLLIPNV